MIAITGKTFASFPLDHDDEYEMTYSIPKALKRRSSSLLARLLVPLLTRARRSRPHPDARTRRPLQLRARLLAHDHDGHHGPLPVRPAGLTEGDASHSSASRVRSAIANEFYCETPRAPLKGVEGAWRA